MTDRADIAPRAGNGFRRLSYTCRCGWVDWGHARPDSARGLKHQLDAESALGWPLLDRIAVTLNGQPAYVLAYGQAMGNSRIQVGNLRHWVVRKGLNVAARERVGLAIFMATSLGFEALQGRFPFSIASGASSFSPEDLVSNLIGFHAAFHGVPRQAEMRRLCGEVGVAESYKVWDDHLPDGLAGLENRRFRPILFPCRACQSRDTSFPPVLDRLTAEPPGRLHVQPKRRFLPPVFGAGQGGQGPTAPVFDFDSTGAMRVVGAMR